MAGSRTPERSLLSRSGVVVGMAAVALAMLVTVAPGWTSPAFAILRTFPPWDNRWAAPADFTLLVGQTETQPANVGLLLDGVNVGVSLIVERFNPTAAGEMGGFLLANQHDETILSGGFPAYASTILSRVGAVDLGRISQGVHLVPWNFQVNGQTLGAGTYVVDVFTTKGGVPTGLPEPAPSLLQINGDGSVSAALISPADPFAFAINANGTVGPVDLPAASSTVAGGWWVPAGAGVGGLVLGLIAASAVRRRRTRLAPPN
ncbi:MAG: hypothetical protein ACYDB7_05970 [Mycobacteriales bacterium]